GQEMQSALCGFQRERIEMAADPLCCLPEQPFEAGPQTDENSKEQKDFGPSVVTEVCADDGGASLELVRHIGHRMDESNNVLADRTEMGVEIMRNRLPRGILRRLRRALRLLLLLEPCL